jgi:hypothetical protein
VKAKTYRKPVFAGKDVPVIGLDQGKGRMYHGLGSHYCFNFFYEASMDTRTGQVTESNYTGGIQHGGVENTLKFIHEDGNIWIEGT